MAHPTCPQDDFLHLPSPTTTPSLSGSSRRVLPLIPDTARSTTRFRIRAFVFTRSYDSLAVSDSSCRILSSAPHRHQTPGVTQLIAGRTSGLSSSSELSSSRSQRSSFQADNCSTIISFLERSSVAEQLARRPLYPYQPASSGSKEMLSRLVSVCDPRLSDVSRPHGGQFLSSDEQALAYREIFTRRADVVTIDARDFSIDTCPNLEPHSHNPGSSLCDDAASDLAEYGDSVQHHASSHGHSDFKGNDCPSFHTQLPLIQVEL
jgi:hypothetical protein